MKPFYERYWKNKEVLEDFSYKWPVIKKVIPVNKKIKILDFGCGKGTILSEIISMNPSAEITAVDVSGEALRFVKKRFPKIKLAKIKDGEKLPFKTHGFDFIIASDVIEHIYDTENVLAELSRILKPKGKLLISVPYNGKLKNTIITLFFYEFIFNPYSPHIRFFSKKSLKNCLEKVNLKPVQWGYYGRFFPFSNGMFVLAQK